MCALEELTISGIHMLLLVTYYRCYWYKGLPDYNQNKHWILNNILEFMFVKPCSLKCVTLTAVIFLTLHGRSHIITLSAVKWLSF
jgi:hypothetical protein